jgi:tetratricopeptide (TPR) repeat protein
MERFDLVIRENPQNGSAHYYRALCFAGKGENKLAEQDLLKAVEINPGLVDARIKLAQGYLRSRNKDLAREQIEALSEQAPDNLRVLMLRGGLKVLEKDPKGAEDAYKQAIEKDPDYIPAHVRLGHVYAMTQRRDDAISSYQKTLEINPRQRDALAALVGIYAREKKYDEAVALLKDSKSQASDHKAQQAFVENLLGQVHLAKKDTQQARVHFERAIETYPDLLGPYVALARIYVAEDKLDEAITQYQAMLERKPQSLAGHMALGTLYDLKGEGVNAETHYREALEIRRDFAPAANNLAWNLAERGGNIDEALGYAQIAKEKMPNSSHVMDTLGWIYYLKGSYLNAIAELEESVRIEPENALINYHLGMAYYKNEQLESARQYLEKALGLDGGFDGSEEARRVLTEIKSSMGTGG